MSWFGKRPDADGQVGGTLGGAQAGHGIKNWINVHLRGIAPQAPQQKVCPNGHFAPVGAQRCGYCGYQWF